MVGFQLNLIVFDCQAARGTISTLTSNTGILLVLVLVLVQVLVLVLVLVLVIDFFSSEFQATKNPSTLNQNGGVDGLHKLGTSKKSSGNSYD
ncbi:TPA: hypothetical protein ACPYV3_004767 [Citrobacter freundii]|uniref:Uncharacterized protein n=1 Tax=Citrobacter freundii TaxID=546 RepID=A0AAD2XZ74_CITFR|nr:hypothetical protein [Citrobacter freundii]EJG2171358.1 hypothetical protein [Citrobacter freundii 47N]EJY9175444.1 hypothetical protein [Citrobacter freundii]EKT9390299.1 hypothetical protein [Citrobacter freundii]EKU0870112.1 hypothetical protein [Citrobacter freundii]EKU1809849.1 hypothetical protein [Citrobacter freundii]